MKTIWKYELLPEATGIAMPKSAKVIATAIRVEHLCIWAEVDTNEETALRTFEVFGTGHPFPNDGKRRFIGTAIMLDGSLVWHVYERL